MFAANVEGFMELEIMERSSRSSRLLPALAAAWLCACAGAPPAPPEGAPVSQEDARAVRENAENNLAFAKDQASLWLESQKDHCATDAVSDREACAAAAKASYEQQVAAAQQKYEAICRRADADPRATSAASQRN